MAGESSRPTLKIKIWLEKDGEPVMGEGRLELLKAVAETGSLSGACEKLGISYRHAWGQIRKMEQRLGFALMERRTGGTHGGGATLTEGAINLITDFTRKQRDVLSYAERTFKSLHF